jgi:hypothetical protein
VPGDGAAWNLDAGADVSLRLPVPRDKGGVVMPAKSKAQQMAAGAALAAKRGEIEVSELKGASKEMYESMSERQLAEFAETERKGLPRKKSG